MLYLRGSDCGNNNRRWYKRCNNIVSHEFICMHRACDYFVECPLVRAVIVEG